MMEAPLGALLEHIRKLSTGAAQLARALPLFDPLRARYSIEQELHSTRRVSCLPCAAASNVLYTHMRTTPINHENDGGEQGTHVELRLPAVLL
jgi:hypothetical protein